MRAGKPCDRPVAISAIIHPGNTTVQILVQIAVRVSIRSKRPEQFRARFIIIRSGRSFLPRWSCAFRAETIHTHPLPEIDTDYARQATLRDGHEGVGGGTKIYLSRARAEIRGNVGELTAGDNIR